MFRLPIGLIAGALASISGVGQVAPLPMSSLNNPIPRTRSPGGRAHRRWRKRRAAGRA